ncbi:hypothetical protein FHP29_06070 [Nocardioides albidus]|uniref:Uncharacterized protein n=1 Tax=Nocardioides albidus TaxID=1517589 RepID=A0A5C4W549_9ACTN|nr:hypothetical protein [Nocardioides albidus]TNM43260.1 hypothetical protein FHP29_06070 [Nocardioides albidus]
MIREPVPTMLERVLLRAVREHAATEGRCQLRPALHVGIPGAEVRSFPILAEEPLDLALRTEVLEAMCRDHLARDVVPLVWLTRTPEGHDAEDLAWAAAVGCAGPELGVRLDLVVVTRRSWHDPRSGVGRRWTRLRRRDP